MEDLLWAVIREDEGGNRYRVGRYGTREEAERVARRFDDGADDRRYVVERVDQRRAS
ncbi:SPOR domain-containing protein [Streptomyces sp. PTM05]|uniref:SPOR domain-containing protein n=1 Tax=Streptantibioticus parmotrematis TaxID=2873249 RepID=A0ABS7QME7_9ACTN|nr:SPOR domain-containing protein [Streptantibioticus parmotrematis]MBY8884103.1 SPOR domain-containing protein [Streptantibioticus parmotrematis]